MPKTTSVFTYAVLAALAVVMAGGVRAEEEKGQPALAISGLWYTQDREGGVELYPCDGKVCGRFYWLKDDDEDGADVSRDDHNPDPGKRTRPLCRMQFMGGFKPDPDKEGHYVDGWIYSPRHGKVFNADMTLVDHDRLELHGYVIVPLFGESQVWTRTASLPKCKRG